MSFTPYELFNGTTLEAFLAYPNTLTGNYWGPLLVTIIFIILTVLLNETSRVNRIEEAALVSGFTTSVLSVLFAAANIIPGQIAFFPIVITGIIAFILFISKR